MNTKPIKVNIKPSAFLMDRHQLGCEIEAIAQQISIHNSLNHKSQVEKLVNELLNMASQIK